MMQHSAPDSTRPALPIISVAGLDAQEPQTRAQVGQALKVACQGMGFFYCVDHGIPTDLIADVFAQSCQFFALPEAEKQALNKNLSLCQRGYEPLRDQTLEEGTPSDLKEGFYSGPEKPLTDPDVMAGRGSVAQFGLLA